MRFFLNCVVQSAAVVLCSQAVAAQLADLQPGRNFPTAVDEFGTSRSENVDVGDCDNDGDYDVIVANGGSGFADGNTISINLGGIQGGTQGTFADETSVRFAGIPDDRSRDIEFADLDGDCDLDIFVANRGSFADGGEVSRAYMNQGGSQLGAVGFFTEETDSFWGQLIDVPLSAQVYGGNAGPWRDFSCDCDFGDLDLDGDLDLFHSSYGPNIVGSHNSRVFLNDGSAVFNELWPWINGGADIQTHALDIDLVDLDSDFDLDVFCSSRDSQSRVWRNNLTPAGFPVDPFEDVTQSALIDQGALQVGGFHYESEYGDLDGDGDFDLYLLSYENLEDRVLENLGGMTFLKQDGWVNGDPKQDENEVDFLDFDSDGDLDVFAANFSGTNFLYVSGLAQGSTGNSLLHRAGWVDDLSQYPRPEGPLVGNGGTTLDADCADMDGDGDPDILLANDGGANNRYWENQIGVPDTHAPTVQLLTAQGDKSDGSDTPIRAQLRDNAAYYVIAYYDVDLLYTVNGGIENRIAMFSQGSQQFQAVIPGGINGVISYRVVGSDDAGNSFSSATLSYTQTSSGVALLQSLDDGTPGLHGQPYLQLHGSFVGGSTVTNNLCSAAANALSVLFLSLSSTPLPFKGGLLHTVPIVAELPLTTDAGGQVFFEALWPGGLPPGTQVWFQYGVSDGAGFGGVALSNAVVMTQP